MFAGFGKKHSPPTALVLNVRRYALEALLANLCTTTPPSLFTVSLDIVAALVFNLHHLMKHEITVLLVKVLLPMLRHTCTSFSQRIALLKLLQRVCEAPTVLLPLFVNNDCDHHCLGVVERIVETLVDVVLTDHTEKHWITPQECSILHHYALQALVAFLKSIGTHIPVVEEDRPSELLLDLMKLLRARIVWNSQGWKAGLKLLERTDPQLLEPPALARFLKTAPGLSKLEIGKYFAPNKEGHLDVYRHFLSLFEFRAKDLDVALRELMTSFRIQGESQIIERLISEFATKYNAECNQLFTPDGVFFLSYAIILLNTQKHNPNAEKAMEMTRDQFVSYHKGQDGGKDFDGPLLHGIYDRISRQQIKIDCDTDPVLPCSGDIDQAPSISAPPTEQQDSPPTDASVFLTHSKAKQIKFIADAKLLCKEAMCYLKQYAHTYQHSPEQGVEVIGTLFCVAWPHILTALHKTFNRAYQQPVLALCLEAFTFGRDIGVYFLLDTTELNHIAERKQELPCGQFDINCF
eukprot:NODE_304_length_2453_cov_28.890800_g282_i0.p1 GENE.NODE_304_length_2453_cov_28.890800_g282_i0~~NODE_304_length_2453_cov_28.890800_g282_i0.p1  ORF type:complete len:521 (-),score=168.18 NODE_304_length_2453_cov_28.890800_g282_i0:16-1578(-)